LFYWYWLRSFYHRAQKLAYLFRAWPFRPAQILKCRFFLKLTGAKFTVSETPDTGGISLPETEGFKGKCKCKFSHPEKQEHHGLTERKATSNNRFNLTGAG
jgi:hypothetical protein